MGSASVPNDALDWFGELSKLPPDPSVPAPQRGDLIDLFDRVQFHPLSVAVLTQQLKTRSANQLGRRLEAILREDAVSAAAAEGTPTSLIASLQLSLERLTEAERHAVRRLGVFQGGAFEDDLLAITELGESESSGENLWLVQSNRGEQLLASSQIGDAAEIFSDILKILGKELSYKRAVTLARLGRCYRDDGHPDFAKAQLREGIVVTQEVEQSDDVKRIRGQLQTELADVLRHQGKFAEAREQYAKSLKTKREIGGELQGEGVVLVQLGTLARLEGNLSEAVKSYYAALKLFQCLHEPASEVTIRHQLGMVFQKSCQWEQAEKHYRKSASLAMKNDNLAGAARTWNQLAIVSKATGKLEAAEAWYRKAIDVGRQSQDVSGFAKRLRNLANLLLDQPGRLAEARQLAEESLTLAKTLDPGAAEIWKTYSILAEIADKESEPDKAADYRRLTREARRNFAGTAHEMRQFAPVITAVVGAVAGNEDAKSDVNQLVAQGKQAGGKDTEVASSIERILAGERDVEALCSGLGLNAFMIIETILQALEDPSILQDLLPEDGSPQ